MIRRAFLRRMAFAAAACAFFDVPLPKWGPLDYLEEGMIVGFYARRTGVVTAVDNAGKSITIDWGHP